LASESAARPVDLELVLVVLLSLALSASLWWLYFRDEDGVEQAMVEAPEPRRARLALVGFGYWHYGLLLGVVSVAAGLKKAVGDPYDPLGTSIGSELALGVAAVRGLHRRVCSRARARLSPRADGRRGPRHGDDSRRHRVDGCGRDCALTAIVVGALVLEARRHASNS
jgi:hypothetical protein